MNTAVAPIGGEHLPRRLLLASFTLLVTALLFDLVDLTTRTGAMGLPAYWLAGAGVVVGVAAGLCHLWPLARTGAAGWPWRLTAHPGFFKAVAIGLCAAGWSLRTVEGDVPAAGLAMALLGMGFASLACCLPSGADEGTPADPEVSRGCAGPTEEDRGPAPEKTARGL